MDGFADLLTDAFSESSVPSFSDGDLDFESLGFEEKGEEDKEENSTTKTDERLLQEVTDESEALLGKATTDALLLAEDEESTGDEDDLEEFEREESQESCTSSEEERSSSGEDVENVGAAGDLLMSVCCSDDPYDDQTEDGIFAEGRPLASEGADSPNDGNKVLGEAESDEEVSCIRGIPECGDETVIMIEAEEGKGKENLSDSDHEDLTAEEEENVPTHQTKTPNKISPMVEEELEFPCLSLQNLQDLVTEVDGEEEVLKMTDFTGDEHQEAGETIADYPSDFSSGEFTRAGLNASPLLPELGPGDVTETTCISGIEDSGYEKDDGFLYSTDLEMNADEITSLDGAAGEEREHESAVTGENNSYSSDDDEELLRRTKNELMSVRGVDNNRKVEDVRFHEFSKWSSSDDTVRAREDPADFIRSCFDTVNTNTHLPEYLLTREDTDDTEDSSSDENQRPAEDECCYSVVQKVTTIPSNQGSIDDSFFFNTGSSEVTEQLVDDEEEEKRNAEQMQERIEAFKRFYDNCNDENGREERQIKVQFCAEPLSRVNYYDTDSDRDSLGSSTDTEEDLSSDELREPEDLLRKHEDRAEPEDLLREPEDRAEPEDLLREPEDLLREREDRAEPEDLLREHEDRAEPEDLLREPEDRAEPEDLLREPEDRAEPEDLLRDHEDRAEPEDLLRDHEDRAEPEDLLREPEDIVEPKDLLREPEDRAEPEDLLREPEDRAEPEDLLRDHEDRAEPEDLLREPEDRAEPEDLLGEPEDRAEPEDLLREPEDIVEPKDLLRESKDLAEPENPLKEFEDTPEITPVCDPPNPEQPQSVSGVKDLQTCSKTRKGVSKLKLILNLGVVMMLGLLMFWLMTDQADWLKDIFSL